MNLDGWNEADRLALQAFYEAGQQWSWQEISDGSSSHGRNVRSWIESSTPPRNRPIILPALRQGHQEPQWFAIAFSEAQAEELREQLIAFVGPAGSDFRGRRADLNQADALDRAAGHWVGGSWFFSFTALAQFRPQVREALECLRRVWRLKPNVDASIFRTTEAMLREFFSALANGDESASQRWLDEVRACGRLSAENLQFLEIERLGALGYWDELALHPHLSLLVAMRRPRRITALLIEALWRLELAHFLQENQSVEAVTYVREKFLPRYEGLLRSRGPLIQSSVVLTFLLTAVATVPQRSEQIPFLLAAIPSDAPERAFAEAIAAQVSPNAATDSIDVLTLARQALTRKDFDTAWLHLETSIASVESCELRLDCAAELLSSEIALAVAHTVNQLEANQFAEVMRVKRHARTWQDIQAMIAPRTQIIPVDWETWFEAVVADPTWDQALESVHAGLTEWSVEHYRRNPARVTSVCDSLHAPFEADAAQVVRLALPQVARFFLPDGIGERVFSKIYRTLVFVLVLDDHFGGDDWITTQNLVTAILDTGPSASEYAETLELLTLLWKNRGEVARLDWALDLLDALVVAPPLQPNVRSALFTSIWQTFNMHSRRVCRDHREVFRLLCQDLDRSADFAALPLVPEVESVDASISLPEHLRGKLVAIYTLTESAGLRAKRVLESLFHGLDVRVSHDHGGTERLRSLGSPEADYFLVATRSAKHAATEFIKVARASRGREVIYPTGKGSSSLVTALKEAVLLSR